MLGGGEGGGGGRGGGGYIILTQNDNASLFIIKFVNYKNAHKLIWYWSYGNPKMSDVGLGDTYKKYHMNCIVLAMRLS